MKPQVIIDEENRLNEFVQAHSDCGLLKAKDVAEYLGVGYQWLIDAICSGEVPFAFGTTKGKGRSTTCIPVLSFYNFIKQKGG